MLKRTLHSTGVGVLNSSPSCASLGDTSAALLVCRSAATCVSHWRINHILSCRFSEPGHACLLQGCFDMSRQLRWYWPICNLLKGNVMPTDRHARVLHW